MSSFRRLMSFLLISCLSFSGVSYSHNGEVKLAGNVEYDLSRPDSHAPISVMGDHLHNKGEWMLSYRYMFMRMVGNRDGSNGISNQQVFNSYVVTPTSMNMQMHMIGLMMAPSDYVTLMAMLPFVRKDMTHRVANGRTFTTRASGLSDVKLTGLVKILDENRHRAHLNLGISFPTGSIDKRHDIPIGKSIRMPYPMQLGSGTYDLLPGITYTGQSDSWSWGAQHISTIRTGRNHIGYALGNQYEVTTWLAKKWTEWLSQSVGAKYTIWQNIDGVDPTLNPAFVSTADPNSRGGKRIDLLLGANIYFGKGILKGHRLAFDFGIPIYQNLDGPQLETDWYGTVGWQNHFDNCLVYELVIASEAWQS